MSLNSLFRPGGEMASPAGRTGRWSLAFFLLAGVVALGELSASANETNSTVTNDSAMSDKTFGEDVEFLKRHVETIVLEGPSGRARTAIVPAYQGRVMTSSATGFDGTSFGWINYAHIDSDEIAPHINVYGGEERFWLGPEGGQFSIYFAPGATFEFDDWQTPAVIDTEPYAVVAQGKHAASFQKKTSLINYSKTKFDLQIDREVKMLSVDDAVAALGRGLGEPIKQLDFVGFRTTNQVTNTGDAAWTRETGMLSVWLLGMYKPGPQTTVVVPFVTGSEEQLGATVNDAYFGKVPSNRLRITDGVMYFSADGTYRSKIGISPRRSLDVCGSFDAKRGVLTIVKYNKPGPEVTDYVNSMWELQDKPYDGDTVNAYNDGPPEPGAKPLGPFYELETSSPALALKPGESGVHIQETYHLQGDLDALDRVSNQVLGVSLEQITSALD